MDTSGRGKDLNIRMMSGTPLREQVMRANEDG